MNRNRDKGIRWELSCLFWLKQLFPNTFTSRNASRLEDANCVDFVGTGDFAFQCKAQQVVPQLSTLFKSMNTTKTKVVLWKNTKVRGTDGEFAIMKLEDFKSLITNEKETKES